VSHVAQVLEDDDGADAKVLAIGELPLPEDWLKQRHWDMQVSLQADPGTPSYDLRLHVDRIPLHRVNGVLVAPLP
jgi:hypothetical protein